MHGWLLWDLRHSLRRFGEDSKDTTHGDGAMRSVHWFGGRMLEAGVKVNASGMVRPLFSVFHSSKLFLLESLEEPVLIIVK